MIDVEQLADPVVRAFVAAVNAGDRDAFFALLAPGATMSDDGSERNLEEWVDREIFSSDGRMEVESEKPIPAARGSGAIVRRLVHPEPRLNQAHDLAAVRSALRLAHDGANDRADRLRVAGADLLRG